MEQEVKKIQCPHCKEQINAKATRCPHCGGKIPHMTIGKAILTIFMVCFVIVICVNINESVANPEHSTAPQAPTPEQIEAQAKAQKEWEASPAGVLCAKHTDWIKDDCDEYIADGGKMVWVGMPYSMLVYMRGKPDDINPSDYGSGIRYQYCWDDRTPSCFYDEDDDGRIDSYN